MACHYRVPVAAVTALSLTTVTALTVETSQVHSVLRGSEKNKQGLIDAFYGVKSTQDHFLRVQAFPSPILA